LAFNTFFEVQSCHKSLATFCVEKMKNFRFTLAEL
jgi:hypothetical protein